MKTTSIALVILAILLLVTIAVVSITSCAQTKSLLDETLLVEEKTDDGELVMIHEETGEKLPRSEVEALPQEEQAKYTPSYIGPKTQTQLNEEGWGLYGIGGVSLAALLSIAGTVYWRFRKKKYTTKKGK